MKCPCVVRAARLLLAGLLFAPWVHVAAEPAMQWSVEEIRQIQLHGPWPPPLAPDPSNRVSGHAAAVAFGERLFFSPRLSGGGLLCASCHAPWRGFVDGRDRAQGLGRGDRNTPTLWNVRFNQWFGWDGAHESLWAQSIRPLFEPREMGSSPSALAALIRRDAGFAADYQSAFGRTPPDEDALLVADLGKALAAFQETLVSPPGAFDQMREALAAGASAPPPYPQSAQRGLRLFIGRAGCATCHAGPLFSDGRFHPSAIASVTTAGVPDTGREAAIAVLNSNPYRRRGRFDDAAGSADPLPAILTAVPGSANSGAFRTPGLREVAATGPYMHDGSVARLCDTLRPHAFDPEGPAPAPALSPEDRRDLVAFLRSLSAPTDPVLVPEVNFRCSE